jgi:hypothetical protein
VLGHIGSFAYEWTLAATRGQGADTGRWQLVTPEEERRVVWAHPVTTACTRAAPSKCLLLAGGPGGAGRVLVGGAVLEADVDRLVVAALLGVHEGGKHLPVGVGRLAAQG